MISKKILQEHLRKILTILQHVSWRNRGLFSQGESHVAVSMEEKRAWFQWVSKIVQILPSSRLTDSVIAKPTERDSLTRMGRPAYDADLKKRVRLSHSKYTQPRLTHMLVFHRIYVAELLFFSGAQAFIQRQIIVLVSRKEAKGFLLDSDST